MSGIIKISYKTHGSEKSIIINSKYIISVNIEKWIEGNPGYLQGGIINILYNNRRKDTLKIDNYNKSEIIYNSIIENLD